MRIKYYEKLYMLYIIILTVVSFFYIYFNKVSGLISDFSFKSIKFDIIFLVILLIINLIKLYAIKNEKFTQKHVYVALRISEITALSAGAFFIHFKIASYAAVIFLILITSFINGMHSGIKLYSYACLIFILFSFLKQDIFTEPNIVNVILIAFAIAALVVIWLYILKDNFEYEKKSESMLAQMETKCNQLSLDQKELLLENKQLKEENEKLENTNKKLSQSIGEYYTLQMISQAISSILDIKELLKYVNDIIIGIMGVNNCHIILFDDKTENLYLHTTNLIDAKELEILIKNITSEVFMDVINNNKPIIDNNVNEEKYPFLRGRDIKSFICIPLYSKTTKLGLILIEHKNENAFGDNSVRLLGVIGQQIGITLENVLLYKNMQDMATIDGLTGVYNRLYFQSRVITEYNKAVEKGYKLSIAIFDIDYFKRFNDTYGHLFGDKVIKTIAATIKESLGENDIIARYGGEEFVILYPQTDLEEAYQKVEKLRKILEQIVITDGKNSASVTASFGVACYPDNADNVTQLLRISDKALYRAKETGRNRVVSAEML